MFKLAWPAFCVPHTDENGHSIDNQGADVVLTVKKVKENCACKNCQQEVATDKSSEREKEQNRRENFNTAEHWANPCWQTGRGQETGRGIGEHKPEGLQHHDQADRPVQEGNGEFREGRVHFSCLSFLGEWLARDSMRRWLARESRSSA
jgi:hypothetical protein